MSIGGAHAEWLPLIPAAGLAATFCFVELIGSLQKRISWHAWHWVLLRLSFEGACGSLAYLIIASTAGPSGNPLMRVVLAGSTGSAILRTQLAVDGKSRNRVVGPGAMYQRLRKNVDDNIDDIGGVTQSRWITVRVLPTIGVLSPQEVAQRAESYFNNLSRLTGKERETIARFIQDTVGEQDTPDEQKRRVLVQRILDEGGRRFVKGLVKTVDSASAPRSEPSSLLGASGSSDLSE
jgi:hypothetical protein